MKCKIFFSHKHHANIAKPVTLANYGFHFLNFQPGGRVDDRLDGEGSGERQDGDAGVPGGGAGGDLPDDDGDRPGRGVAESVPDLGCGREPGADGADPPDAAGEADLGGAGGEAGTPGGAAGVAQRAEAFGALGGANPYAPALTFATGRTRSRRDHEEYLTLIDAIALLHQHQRQAKPAPHAPEGGAWLHRGDPGGHRAGERTGARGPGSSARRVTAADAPSARPHPGLGEGGSTPGARGQGCRLLLPQGTAGGLRVESDAGARASGAPGGKLQYLAVRHGRLGSAFVYELLFDPDAAEAVAHVGLIGVERLRHEYAGGVAGSEVGVAGRNGHLAGGGQAGPPASTGACASAWAQPGGVAGSHIRGPGHPGRIVTVGG